jgi:DNA-binding XRE family transcriptional regulator
MGPGTLAIEGGVSESIIEILSRSFRDLPIPSEMPKGRPLFSGIYLLIEGDEITYIGSSSEVEMRIWMHAVEGRSRPAMLKPCNRVLWMPLPHKVLGYYEGALIRAIRPKCNKSAPRHHGYDNEILDGLGIQVHENEYNNARAWLSLRTGAPPIDRGVTGSRIRNARRRAGITQSALASALDVSKAAVGQWETGVCIPSTDKLAGIASVVGTTVDALLS